MSVSTLKKCLDLLVEFWDVAAAHGRCDDGRLVPGLFWPNFLGALDTLQQNVIAEMERSGTGFRAENCLHRLATHLQDLNDAYGEARWRRFDPFQDGPISDDERGIYEIPPTQNELNSIYKFLAELSGIVSDMPSDSSHTVSSETTKQAETRPQTKESVIPSHDKRKKKIPQSPDVIELCQHLLAKLEPGASMEACARDFCSKNGIDEKKASSLLRQAKRFPHLWKS